MKRALSLLAVVAVFTTALTGQVRRESQVRGATADGGAGLAKKTLDTYCVGCHNSRVKAGDLALDTLSLDAVPEHADVWEKSIRKLRGRLMPPPTSRQPDQREIDAFVTWIEAKLDAAPAAARSRATFRPSASHARSSPRRSTTSSASSSTPNRSLPAEIEVHGFENIATALTRLAVLPRSVRRRGAARGEAGGGRSHQGHECARIVA